MFADRRDAGRRLAPLLVPYRDRSPVVFALPRGGVPVGYEVALTLGAPLDVALVRKIGAPFNPEYGIGAVVDGDPPVTFVDEDLVRRLGVGGDYVSRTAQSALAEIARRRALYRTNRPPVPVAGRTAIVVDDGIATGSTMRVALRALRLSGAARLVMAAPVAPPDTLADLRDECDDAVCVAVPEDFPAVGAFYRDFRQLGDSEVIDLLNRPFTA